MSEPGTEVLGLLGGTFDPLHVAHLRLGLEAREALGLAELCWSACARCMARDAGWCCCSAPMRFRDWKPGSAGASCSTWLTLLWRRGRAMT